MHICRRHLIIRIKVSIENKRYPETFLILRLENPLQMEENIGQLIKFIPRKEDCNTRTLLEIIKLRRSSHNR